MNGAPLRDDFSNSPLNVDLVFASPEFEALGLPVLPISMGVRFIRWEGLREVMATFARFLAICSPIAFPMPVPPPVTRAILSSSMTQQHN